MFKLISFIGTNDYKETTYIFPDREIFTMYFPAAAAVVEEPDEVIISRTMEAAKKHWNGLSREFEKVNCKSRLVGLDIPSGQNEGELWEIFSALVGTVNEGDAVIFDITHSFRSLPLISFMSIIYLKYVKNVDIKTLYYGAYEARNQEENKTPVFDLTGFCSLLDWIVAANSFINHGAAWGLGRLLVDAQKKANAVEGPKRRELGKFGNLVENISKALFTNRPFEVIQETRKLSRYSKGTDERMLLDRDIEAWAPPFGLLLDDVLPSFTNFAGSSKLLDPANIDKHLEIIDWYVRHNYVPQALSMMRELMVSKKMIEDGQYERALNRKSRVDAENRLRSEKSAASELWKNLVNLRNDVVHCGWREGGIRTASKAINETKGYLESLNRLFENN